MSTFVKSINNSQILGVAGGSLNVNSDVTFVGKVYTTNVANCFNLQYGDVTSLQTMVPEINTNYSNTAIGMNTLPLLTSGYGNTSLGSYALNKATIATQNTALGAACLYALTSGQYNTAVGNDCLLQNLTGNNNTGIGKGCMFGGGGNTYSFSNNVGAGHQALGMLETGNFNVGVGTQAGNGLLSGSYNTCIGCTSNVNAGSCTYSTSLGYGSIANASHQVMLGTITENVYIPNTLTTQGLIYEVVGTAGQSTNALTLNYSLSSICCNNDHSQCYISRYQHPNRYNKIIHFFSCLSTDCNKILYSHCSISRYWISKTVISVGGSRRVISSISCCS